MLSFFEVSSSPLQKLHTYQNLHELMQLSDDNDQLENDFKERADELRSKYLENVSNIVLKSEKEVEEAKAAINGLDEKVRSRIFSCFCLLIFSYFNRLCKVFLSPFIE